MIAWVAHKLSSFWELLNYYRDKGYLFFIGKNIVKLTFLYSIVVVGLILLSKFLIDLKDIYGQLTNILTDLQVFIVFAISESTFGMIPPDLFIMWTANFSNPFLILLLLGIISYGAGLIAYFAGRWISRRKSINNFIANRLKNYISLTEKWGGAFIAIAALFPFTPYPLVVIAVSILKYPFNKLMIYGLFRVVRFLVQGVIVLNALDL